jgi:hypothetical protein
VWGGRGEREEKELERKKNRGGHSMHIYHKAIMTSFVSASKSKEERERKKGIGGEGERESYLAASGKGRQDRAQS